MDSPHPAEVNYDSVIAERVTRNVVPPASNSNEQALSLGELHSPQDVRTTRASNNYCRPAVDHRVINLPGFVVTRFATDQHGTANRGT
jgi:hypothetical protein